MARSRIDGSGAKVTDPRKNLSVRATKGKLDVIEGVCKYCHHHKLFDGNAGGQMIKKCCKCKRYQ